MFNEFVTTYAPIVIAMAVLVPVLIAHVAMFIEGVGERKWTTARLGA